MGLSVGAKLGPYEIVAPLGAGGMGEVYRARDTRLGRDVAIKVLPERFSSSADFRQRFEREARTISCLQHPHICVLHDVGHDDAVGEYLVMEFLEGETVAERLKRGKLPLAELVKIGTQIADALDKAHRKGVIHRDLKPANIMLTKSGAKLMDFGLAKPTVVSPGLSPASADLKVGATGTGAPLLSAAATATGGASPGSPITQAGSILGTIQYMSPEQIEGKEADARSDIFAFGATLYEMATGARAFGGKSQISVASAILEKDPEPISKTQPLAPAALDRLVAQCLAKNPDERFQSAHDVGLELKWISTVAPVSPPAAGSRVGTPALQKAAWVVAAAGVLAAIILAAVAWRATRPVEQPLTRLSVDLGPEAMAGVNLTAAISPDGRRLVYAVHGPDGKQQLATRLLDQTQATVLTGTEGGSDPFFSPDGQWIGFSADNQLQKISVQGGAPAKLATTGALPQGASWGQDGNIVAALGPSSPLLRIPAAGGLVEALTKLGPGENAHRWPQVLPGGAAVLFLAGLGTGADNANIEALSLKTGQVKVVLRGGYYGRYLPSGHLVYLHQGVLFGVGFDPERLEVRGSPTPLLEDVAANAATGGGQFDFSATGTFVYAAGKSAAQTWQFAWLDTSGKTSLFGPLGTSTVPHLSPNGRKLAYSGDGSDVYIYDLDRDTTTRLTFSGHAFTPVWAPDGKHLVFRTTTGNKSGIYWVRSDGAGELHPLLKSTNVIVPWSISPDGRRLAYFEKNSVTGYDLWTLPLDLTDREHPKPGQPEPFLRTPAEELVPRFSPDGRWIAYRSNESGSDEIYVRPFPPGSGGKWQISAGGGSIPLWANNGRELFYETTDNHIMVVDYRVEGNSFVPGKPRLWSDKQLFYTESSNLDLAPDGKRFVVLALPEAPAGEKGSVHVTMLLNFFDELKRRIPPGGK